MYETQDDVLQRCSAADAALKWGFGESICRGLQMIQISGKLLQVVVLQRLALCSYAGFCDECRSIMYPLHALGSYIITCNREPLFATQNRCIRAADVE